MDCVLVLPRPTPNSHSPRKPPPTVLGELKCFVRPFSISRVPLIRMPSKNKISIMGKGKSVAAAGSSSKSPKKTPTKGTPSKMKRKPLLSFDKTESSSESMVENDGPESDDDLAAARSKLFAALARASHPDTQDTADDETDQSMSPPSKMRRKGVVQK